MTVLPAPLRLRPHCIAAVVTLLCLAGLCLAGCDAVDPYMRPELWRPAGINEMNFEVQVANARDLQMGRGSATVDGETAAAPVDRLRRDKIKALPTSTISTIGSSGSAGSGGSN